MHVEHVHGGRWESTEKPRTTLCAYSIAPLREVLSFFNLYSTTHTKSSPKSFLAVTASFCFFFFDSPFANVVRPFVFISSACATTRTFRQQSAHEQQSQHTPDPSKSEPKYGRQSNAQHHAIPSSEAGRVLDKECTFAISQFERIEYKRLHWQALHYLGDIIEVIEAAQEIDSRFRGMVHCWR